MLKGIFVSFIISAITLPVSASVSDYRSALDCKGVDSFNWYCSEEKKKPKQPPEEQQQPTPEKKETQKEEESYEERMLKKFDEMVERLEVLKKIAIIDPTEENLGNYIAYQLEIQEKAAVFTDTWKRAQWADPELDYSTRFTMNNIGKQIDKKLLDTARLETLKELNQMGWGLWFFYSSTCAYCHRMVPSINMIQDKGMQVLPVSIDGGTLNGLSMNHIVDSGEASELGVNITPSIFLVNTNSRLVVPLAYGMTSYQELVKRIYVIVKTKPGDNY